MSSRKVPAMAGLINNNSSQLTFSAPKQSGTKPKKREVDPYTICNIGKRIWNPITQLHVDYQEFYRLVRDEGIDLSILKINSHINVGTSNGNYKFDGTMSETEFLTLHGFQDDYDLEAYQNAIDEAKKEIEKLKAQKESTVTDIRNISQPAVREAELKAKHDYPTNQDLISVLASQSIEMQKITRDRDAKEKTLKSIDARLRAVSSKAQEIAHDLRIELGDDVSPF